MTSRQERQMYREAVRETLIDFYDTPPGQADEIVTIWWERLKANKSVFRVGAFMHRLPTYTAANLVDKATIVITPAVYPRYQAMVARVMERVMPPKTSQPPLPVLEEAAALAFYKRSKSERLPTPPAEPKSATPRKEQPQTLERRSRTSR